MNTQTYIDSGILELYVAGALTAKENEEVYNMMLKHPEVTQEVLAIETAVLKLTKEVAPKNRVISFETILSKLRNGNNNDAKIIALNKPKNNWFTYTGWAATILLAAGLLWTINEKNNLESEINTVQTEKEFFENRVNTINTDLAETKTLLNALRAKDIITIPLAGQAVYPEAYAKAYWDKESNTVYLDLQGLPEPPEGKVYQAWSLTLNPLTPTSLGTIDNFKSNENKIFKLTNANESQAFGITLEPAGGSASPTLEQLYTLGALQS